MDDPKCYQARGKGNMTIVKVLEIFYIFLDKN